MVYPLLAEAPRSSSCGGGGSVSIYTYIYTYPLFVRYSIACYVVMGRIWSAMNAVYRGYCIFYNVFCKIFCVEFYRAYRVLQKLLNKMFYKVGIRGIPENVFYGIL